MTLRTALITGVTGQDGVLLARHLKNNGYRVIGTRQPGVEARLAAYLGGVTVVDHDLVDTAGFADLLAAQRPDEVYNLAAFSSVSRSWNKPELVREVNAAAVERMLAILVDCGRPVRFFQASSSEVFGPNVTEVQHEDLPHRPSNPYGAAKSVAHAATVSAREAGLFACVGILYNHESPLRDPHFVTRKIARAAAEIAAGGRNEVMLGNLDISRDWGAAREYVAAMHAALRHDDPGDYVIATGQLHTLRELVEAAFEAAGIEDGWRFVRQDPELIRHSDPTGPVGDTTRIRDVLGWQATVSFVDVIREMVQVDLRRVQTGVEESPDYLGRERGCAATES